MRSTVGSLVRHKSKENDKSGISQVGALTSSLAACLGTGNIVGVATALCSGGAGAVFWMCMSAILGMMTCCCENILGIKYRVRNASGNHVGGPMYYIENGLGMKNLARIYAVFLVGASLGMGNMTQANSLAQGMSGLGISPAVTGAVLCAVLLLSLYILGKLKQRAGICQIRVGIGSFLAHCVKLTDHELFHIGAEGGKTAGDRHVIGNYQFLQLCLIDIGVQVVLNSDLFHDYLLYLSVIMMKITFLFIPQ
jgi:Na+/alanine symporter